MMMGENNDSTADLGVELHAVSCACKPVAGWLAREGIQECREACGGHGYLKSTSLFRFNTFVSFTFLIGARIGDIRNFHDANLTYEGENHVLIQQTSNWLLKLWPSILKGETIPKAQESVSFLNNTGEILENGKLTADTSEELCKPHRKLKPSMNKNGNCSFVFADILAAFQWLVCYLLKSTYYKFQQKLDGGFDQFWAKNEVQVFYAKNLTIAFIEVSLTHGLI